MGLFGRTYIALLLLCATTFDAVVIAQDYQVKAQLPSFTRDADTTFLVELSSQKSSADYAAGASNILVSPAGFSGGAYAGTVGFSSAQNFNSAKWTVELLIYLPSSPAQNGNIELGGYSTSNASLSFLLDSGWGARTRAYTWAAGSSMNVAPYSGGNGRSIQASATDQWVYVAFGVDYTSQLARVIARNESGMLLNQDINFLGGSGVDTSFLSSYPQNQQVAELARRWNVLLTNLSTNIPAMITLGSPSVKLRAIKISRAYRNDLLNIAPELPQSSSSVWIPSTLDSSRTLTSTETRTVGYPGYNNFVTMDVDEAKLVIAPGSAPISIQLNNLPVGVYSFMLYGTVASNGRQSLERVWKPTPMNFTARNAQGLALNRGRLLLKQGFKPRRMQGFHLQVDSPTNVTAIFELPSEAQETIQIQKIVLIDQLAGLPDVAVKSSQNLASGAHGQLTGLSIARKARDDAIWAALPPLNIHLQVHSQVAEFKNPPNGAAVDNWILKATNGIQFWNWPLYTFSPVEFLNLSNMTTFPTANIYQSVPWPGSPSDSGDGIYFSKSAYPQLLNDIYNSKRAELLGAQYLLFAGAITDSEGSYNGLKLANQYFLSGDPEIGHDGAMALVRWAHDWPALEMSLHELRLSTHSPDFEFNVDWSDGSRRNGKMFYEGWSGNTANWLLKSYDQLFPYIKDNQIFADAVHRFIPWINTPQDVVRYLDRYLVFASVRDVQRGLIDGAANVQANAAAVLGPTPYSQHLFDLTKEKVSIYPANGTYQELYATALSRSGVYYIGSFLTYAFGDAQTTIHKAYLQKLAKDAGVNLSMDLSDVGRYPKVRGAGNFLINMWVAGGFPFMVGDASGGPHSGLEAKRRLTMPSAVAALKEAFALYGDPRHAWLLKNVIGDSNPTYATAAYGLQDPIAFAESRVIPDYGAVIEAGSSEIDPLKKTAMTLRLGIGQGHAHSDYLDLNFFAMGLPVSVDLACRNEGDNWSRPSANWSFVHNHALAHTSLDPNGAGAQAGEPWLRAFAPPVLQASYVEKDGLSRLDRDAILMEVGSSGTYYAFDVQRISGRSYHTWAFHGAESKALDLNIPMSAQTVRWIDRTLEGTHYTGTATSPLQATWTMTRSADSYPFSFDGGGVIQTVAAEPAALGSRYDPSLAPLKMRATLLGQTGATVLQGNPYSKAYAYAFPFLWVQKAASGVSIFPAIYEWFRGDVPTVAKAEILSMAPLMVKVTLQNGQVDYFESREEGALSIVSHDSAGIRWAKFVGVKQNNFQSIGITSSGGYNAIITDIDYQQRTLTTSAPLPTNPHVIAGNSARKIFLQLKGSGTNFSWDDDLLVNEGAVTSLKTGTNSITLSVNQSVLFAGVGNRSPEGMVVTNESGSWHFRNGLVVKQPAAEILRNAVFADNNGDGFINAKTYEIGIGDTLEIPSDITIRRSTIGYEILTNVDAEGSLGTLHFSAKLNSRWMPLQNNPEAPRGPTQLRAIRQ